MKLTDQQPKFAARFQTINYFNTTNLCLEFFIWMRYELDPPVIRAMVISEENVQLSLIMTAGEVLPGWNRFYSALPDGVYRVVFEGKRSSAGVNGIFIDDIRIQSCTAYGMIILNISSHVKSCTHV